MSNLQVANTILAQLGGRRFIAMTGAKQFLGDENSLRFCIGRGAVNKANKVQIELMPSDTYTVRFYHYRRPEAKLISEHDGVYWDDLQTLFTRETGMYTHL